MVLSQTEFDITPRSPESFSAGDAGCWSACIVLSGNWSACVVLSGCWSACIVLQLWALHLHKTINRIHATLPLESPQAVLLYHLAEGSENRLLQEH